MAGSKDLSPSSIPFSKIFINNQFHAKPQWPSPGTNLHGKTAIVTGSNTGLGYEAVHQLLDLGLSHAVLAVRSLEKGKRAATTLLSQHPKAKIEVWALDMLSYESIQAFAERADAELPYINYVLLNAGVIKSKFTRSAIGHEETFQVNYLSTILLALLFLPILKSKRRPDAIPHLTIVSAALSLVAKFPNRGARPLLPSFDNQEAFDTSDQYNSSKLLAHMFLWRLVDYVSPQDVVVNLADPAWVRGTNLGRDFTGILGVFMKIFALTGRTVRVGASCFVDALVNKGVESHGCFLMSWNVHPFAASLYTPEGKECIDVLWEETLKELSFIKPKTLLDGMRA